MEILGLIGQLVLMPCMTFLAISIGKLDNAISLAVIIQVRIVVDFRAKWLFRDVVLDQLFLIFSPLIMMEMQF